jgi:hypothetical protein
VGAGEQDAAVRLAAFAFLREQVRTYGDLLPRAILVRGFLFEGVRVPLVGPQGIFKPAVLLDVPLSITTAPRVEGRSRPYEDDSISESSGGRAAVSHRGAEWTVRRGLRSVPLPGARPSKFQLHEIVGVIRTYWPAPKRPVLSINSAMPYIRRPRGVHGFVDTRSSTTKATFWLPAPMLRNFRVADKLTPPT